jgi:diadenosine tetraphosphatase ApaH/serine/threonine PP2A family protein phosphatase
MYDLTPELESLICDQLADGKSLNSICKAQGMPKESTVRNWAMEDRGGFFAKYAKARAIGYERMADDILNIADETEVEARHEGEDVTLKLDATAVARNRLRVDTRKWILSKVLPKYADKLVHAGDPENPIEMSHTVTFVTPTHELRSPAES